MIWDKFQVNLEPLRAALNKALGKSWEEWEIPREAGKGWPKAAAEAHARWWEARVARQREIDASIAAKAEFEYLYDKPYVDNGRVRVAGPFAVESRSPHRVLAVDQDDELVDTLAAAEAEGFADMVLEHLRTAGVQQAHKEDRIAFATVAGWPGHSSAPRAATGSARTGPRSAPAS